MSAAAAEVDEFTYPPGESTPDAVKKDKWVELDIGRFGHEGRRFFQQIKENCNQFMEGGKEVELVEYSLSGYLDNIAYSLHIWGNGDGYNVVLIDHTNRNKTEWKYNNREESKTLSYRCKNFSVITLHNAMKITQVLLNRTNRHYLQFGYES